MAVHERNTYEFASLAVGYERLRHALRMLHDEVCMRPAVGHESTALWDRSIGEANMEAQHALRDLPSITSGRALVCLKRWAALELLVSATKALCARPEGSAVALGAHNDGPYHSSAVDAWNAVHDAIREVEQA